VTEEGPVIAALSGGTCDKVVLDIAHGQAVVRERQLVVVNVIEVGWEKALEESEDDALTNSEKILDQAVRRLKKKSRVAHSAECIQARSAGGALVELSSRIEASLLVVGTRRYVGDTAVEMGSTPNYVIRYAQCPVLLWHSAA
jgi:nucleotide-binding universal stress UspA family protein